MAAPQVLLLDDQPLEIVPSIQRLEQFAKSSKELRQFLQDATDTIQVQAAALSPVELRVITSQNAFRFENLFDLAKACDENKEKMGVIHSVLGCVCSIGELIIHVQNNHGLLGQPGSKVYVLSLGASLLSAAALAAARNVNELCKISLETISITFRLELELRQRSVQIDATPGNWARTVSGFSGEEMQKLLDKFHKTKGTPAHQKIYIAEEAQDWVTISGSPSSLTDLLSDSWELRSAPELSVFAHSALHAPHLCPVDVEQIVGTSPLLQTEITSAFHISSSVDSSPYLAPDLGSLFKQICHSICQDSVSVVTMLQSILTSLVDTPKVDMIMVGSTIRTKEVRRALKDNGILTELIETPNVPPLPGMELRAGSGAVAIVGMSGRFPGSDDVTQFWESLLAGKDFHKKVPEDRFDLSAWNHVSGENSSSVPYGCFLDKPDVFDNQLFNISPREAIQMCPNQRLLLMVSYEALQRAGYSRDGTLSTTSNRIATYFGQTTDDWRDVSYSRGIDIYYIPGLLRSFAPGRLNYHYKWEGPSYSIDSTCASSASAIGLACSSLVARECDTALAGGVNSLASPAMFAGLKKGGFLSPTGACKTFQEDADGYCRAEGVGVVVLKRLEDAVNDNDNILAVIRGQARNHSAHAVSITNPHVGAQEKLYQKTLRIAGVDADQISYVEMHGTGTQAGDVTEVTAVANALGRGPRNHPLVIGAVKANVGHAEAAAGVISMIKSIMILKTGRIPAQPGFPFKLNPKLPLSGNKIQVADGKTHMPPRGGADQTRKLILNNFDASGGNVCFVIEEAPLKASKSSDMRSYLPVTISGRTPFSLKGNKKRLLEFLLKFPETKLQDFSYTTTARTMHETLKATYVAESVPTLIQKMTDDNSDSADRKESTTAPKVAFVFTGMSAQYSGMGAELFKTNTRFRKSILSMQKVCDHQSLPSFVEIISDPTLDVDNKTTTQVQLAIVALELALADLWRSWGIEPAFVIGHSLGEYAALCVAGVLSVSEALGLVGMRAALMEEMLAPGDFAMLAIASDSIDVSKQLAHLNLTGCSIACLNAPFSTVISGPTREIEELKLHCRSEGKRSTLLRVQFGFHSSQFDPILAEFVARAKVIQFAQPKIPVASTLLGAIVCEAGVFGAEYLAQQARNSVRFIDAVNACVVEGLADAATVWLEVGPDRVCLNFVKEIVEAQNLLTSLKRTEPNWKTMALSAAALYKAHVPILWAEYHKEYVDCLSLLELPTYTFDEKSFWTTYRHDLPATSDQAVLAPIHVPNLSMSLHSVEEESITKESITVKFVSRLADPELFTAVHGHNIEDAALCPGSVFCDMAFTAATYVQSKKGQGKELAMDIKNLTMEHPIVVPETTASNCIKVTAVMNAESQEKLNIAFSHSFQSSSQDTGHCQIVFSDLERRREELMISSFFVKARMDSVISTVTNGSGHRLQKPIIYKLFSNVVKYSSQYQAIDELFWDENAGEAVAKVTLQKHTGTNESHYSPYWLDCMIHLAGFILNTNITAPDDYVYICKAVRSMRIVEKLSTHKQYQSYVRRHKDQQKGLSYSDVYFFDQEELVAVCYGLQFQRLPRTAFARILQQSKSMSSGQELVDGNIDVTRTALSSHAKNFESNRRLSTTVQSPRPGLVSLAPPAPADVDEGQAMSNIILKVVAEETGVKLDDFRPSTEFAEVGVDSLLGIAIIERVRKFTGIQLGANFFMENKTVNDARKLFQKPSETQESQPSTQTTPSTQSSNANSTMTSTTPYSSAASEVSLDELDALERSGYRKKSVEFTSNAVLIHGNPAQHQTSVFLVTDGAGSATAYLHLPRFSSGLPTYALESPFVRCPQQYSHTVEETAAIYIASIRKIQPHGPYVIGGWSAGAVHAYEISRQLLASGETIRSLVIIDMHIPRPMPDGREVTPEFIEKIGVATGINRSRSSLAPAAMTELKQHLLHTIQSLASYKPLPMASDRRPWKSMVIWAGKSLSEVFDEDELQGATDIGLKGEVEGNVMQDPEMDLCAWFFSKRYKFGPNGWDDLLGPVECHTVEADHFSIVQRPAVDTVGQLLEQATAALRIS